MWLIFIEGESYFAVITIRQPNSYFILLFAVREFIIALLEMALSGRTELSSS